jgi:hypothetical protein
MNSLDAADFLLDYSRRLRLTDDPSPDTVSARLAELGTGIQGGMIPHGTAATIGREDARFLTDWARKVRSEFTALAQDPAAQGEGKRNAQSAIHDAEMCEEIAGWISGSLPS